MKEAGASAPWRLGIAAAAALIRSRELSVAELVDSTILRAEETEPRVRAFVELDADGVRRRADELDADLRRGIWHGPLHGVPIAIKDVIDVAGQPTRRGCRAFADAPPAARDAAAVRRLRASGAVILGKTATHELAAGSYTPPTRNPWDPERSPGGSSGGSAAAVAAGSALGAVGTDTLGSVRMPAALCGVVGVKPTYGLIDRAGVLTGTWSLDHVGVLARTVADAGLLLDAMWDSGDRSEEGAAAAGVRIGVVRDLFVERADPGVVDATERAARSLEERGATLVELELPLARDALEIGFVIAGCELSSYYETTLRERGHLIGESVRALLHAGAVRTAMEYLRAQRLRASLAASVRAAFERERIDALLTPTSPLVALRPDEIFIRRGDQDLLAHALLVRNLALFDLTGQPAVTVPAGLASGGLPVGVQLAGRPSGDRRLLGIARTLESALAPDGPAWPDYPLPALSERSATS